MSLISSSLSFAWWTWVVIIAVLLSIKRWRDSDATRCEILSRGRWPHVPSSPSTYLQWHPAGCLKPSIDEAAISHCVSDMTFIGDSTVRSLVNQIHDSLREPPDDETIRSKHSNISLRTHHGTIQFLWDPYLNNTHLANLRDPKFHGADHPHEQNERSPRYAIVGGGLWHARYLNATTDNIRSIFTANVESLVQSRQNLSIDPIFLPVQSPYFPWLDYDRGRTLTPTSIWKMNQELERLSTKYNFTVFWVSTKMANSPEAFRNDGLHHKPFIARMQLEMLVTRLCPRMRDHTCCSKAAEIVHGQIFVLIVAVMVIAGFLLNNSIASRAAATLAAILVYCFCADRTMLFERVNKLVDPQLFVFFSFFALGAGIMTSSPCPNEILCREQTQEWKGWMQIVILLYHYFGMSHTPWAYRSVRVLVAAYFFLTGHGHATYFIQTKDFSFRRVAGVLLRVNLLSCMLPFVMDTYYQFYYFPLLTSIWFFIAWVTIPRALNWYSGVRVAYSATIVTIAYSQSDRFFRLLFRLGMMDIDVREFKFRFGLDLYAAYWGMLLAMLMTLYPNLFALQSRGARTLSWATASATIILYIAYAVGSSKETFNLTHRYFSILPILVYTFSRNASTTWRCHYSRLFAWFGQHSLETFVLQYHIWLAADTHGILHLGLIDRYYTEASTKGSWRFWVEVILITTCFLWVCSGVSKATNVVVKMILQTPDVGHSRADEEEALVTYEKQSAMPVVRMTKCPVLKNWRAADADTRLKVRVLAVVLSLYLLNYFWPWRS